MVSTQLDSYFGIIEERVPPEGYELATGNTNTFRYNDKGILQDSVYKDGIKSTTTTYDVNADVAGSTTSFSFAGLTPSGNVYTLGNVSTGLEKYYVTDNGLVNKYSIEFKGSSPISDGITNDFTTITTYDVKGNVIGSTGTNASTVTTLASGQTDIDPTMPGFQIDSSTNHTDEILNSGTVTGHRETYAGKNQSGTQTSETLFDSNWHKTESTIGGTSTST
ncbi:MAG: hypothetical protein QX193_01300, partial [Methylococcales bacterium]